MTTTSRTRRAITAAAWLTAGAVGATAITGLAFASGAPVADRGALPAAAATSGGATTAPAARRARELRDVLHGRFTLSTGTGGTRTVDVQRGKITAASATSVTLVSTDGFTATYAVGPSTTLRQDRRTVTAGSLAVGDAAVVRASGGTALVVRALSPGATTGRG